MATGTPLSHVRLGAQLAGFYPYQVTIKAANDVGELVVILVCDCAYQPAVGQDPGTLEDEGAGKDRLLLPAWEPTIEAKALAVLEMGGLEKRFAVSDVLPSGDGPDRTVLVVTPWTGRQPWGGSPSSF